LRLPFRTRDSTIWSGGCVGGWELQILIGLNSRSVLSGFKLPDHLCSFQPATLTALLRRCGLRVAALQSAPIILNADLKRNLGKLLVRLASQTLYYLSFQRVVVGYSTLVLARKTSD
jgi:hypothetical protein